MGGMHVALVVLDLEVVAVGTNERADLGIGTPVPSPTFLLCSPSQLSVSLSLVFLIRKIGTRAPQGLR